jgi:hypothetical protein
MLSHHREAWEKLRDRGRVGYQYPILASYAEQNGIDRMDLSVEETTDVADLLKSLVRLRSGPAGEVHRLPGNVGGAEAMFGYFSFPLIQYKKPDMKEEAERRGWMSIMRKTWFCHTPVLGFPCGACHPCEIAQEERMGKRVGHVGPLLARASSLLSWMSRV